MNSPVTTIEIPATLTQAFTNAHHDEDLRRWALEALVLTAVGDNLLSTGKAAELLSLGYFETLALIKARGVPLKVSASEFERDQMDLQRMSDAIDRR